MRSGLGEGTQCSMTLVVSEASAWGAVDFTSLDEKVIHIPSAAAKITSSAMLAVLRIRPSWRFRYGYSRPGKSSFPDRGERPKHTIRIVEAANSTNVQSTNGRAADRPCPDRLRTASEFRLLSRRGQGSAVAGRPAAAEHIALARPGVPETRMPRPWKEPRHPMHEAWVGGPMRGLRPRHESITELSWQEIGLGS